MHQELKFLKVLLRIIVWICIFLFLLWVIYYFSIYKKTHKVILNHFFDRIIDYEDMQSFIQNRDLFNVETVLNDFSKNIIITWNDFNIQKLEWYPTYFVEIPFSVWKWDAVKINFLNANVWMHVYYHNPLFDKDFEYQPFGIFWQYAWNFIWSRLKDPCYFLTYKIWLENQLSKTDSRCNIIIVSNTELYPNLLIERTFRHIDDSQEDAILNIEFLDTI